MPSEEEQVIQMIAQELSSGKSVDQVVAELVQAGVPQNDAYEIVSSIAQQMGGGRARPSQPPARHHGHPWITLTLVIIILFLLWLLMKKR